MPKNTPFGPLNPIIGASEKGKPRESAGRKVNGLTGFGPMTAGLPDRHRSRLQIEVTQHVHCVTASGRITRNERGGLCSICLPGVCPQLLEGFYHAYPPT